MREAAVLTWHAAPRHLLRFIGAPVPVQQRTHIRSTVDVIEVRQYLLVQQLQSPAFVA
jgi:hypothetical protein